MTPESRQILASTSSCCVTAMIGAFGRYFEIIRAVNPLSVDVMMALAFNTRKS